MTLGPSLKALLHLSRPDPSSDPGQGSLLAAPLQRAAKDHLRRAAQTTNHDCLESHITQIESRRADSVAARQAALLQHQQDMAVLKGQVATAHGEENSRRAWHRRIAKEHQAHTQEKRKAELQAYIEAHAPIDCWPYGADNADSRVEKKAYGAELLRAVDERASLRMSQRLADQHDANLHTRLSGRMRERAKAEANMPSSEISQKSTMQVLTQDSSMSATLPASVTVLHP